MRRPLRLDAMGLREKRHWPKIPEDVQAELFDFLAYWRGAAETAALRMAAAADVSEEPEISLNGAEHWVKIVSAIDWLMYRVPIRQRYLECRLAIQEGRFKAPDTRPETSSSPAPPSSSLEPTASTAPASPVGGPPPPPSKRRSRKRGQTR